MDDLYFFYNNGLLFENVGIKKNNNIFVKIFKY